MAKSKDGEKKPSQRAMVQAALEKCGWDSKPGELQKFIMDTFTVELAPNIISNYKSQIKRDGQTSASPAPRARSTGSVGGLQVNDVTTLRSLVSRLGAHQVKELVDAVD